MIFIWSLCLCVNQRNMIEYHVSLVYTETERPDEYQVSLVYTETKKPDEYNVSLVYTETASGLSVSV
jgi:hypothetical protein